MEQWLGVLRVLSKKKLPIRCAEGYLLYSQVHRGGLCQHFVVLRKVICDGEIFACIETSSSSYV